MLTTEVVINGLRERIASYSETVIRYYEALDAIRRLKTPYPKCRDAHAAVGIAVKTLEGEPDPRIELTNGSEYDPPSPRLPEGSTMDIGMVVLRPGGPSDEV